MPFSTRISGVAGVLALLAPGLACAADLPSRKPAPVLEAPTTPSWTGFYAGLNGGYAWGKSTFGSDPSGRWFGDRDWPGIAAVSGRGMNLAGGAIGGTVGYNYQIDRVVVGLELDGGWMGLRDPVVIGPVPGAGGGFYAASTSASSNYLATLRARLGVAVTPSLLAFATGGAAISDVNASQSIYFNNPPTIALQISLPVTGPGGGFNAGAVSGARLGWTLGGGLEWMFARQWSARVEFLHTDFGVRNVQSAYLAPDGTIWTVNHRFRRNAEILRVGLDYHFDWGAGPVVAAY
jgi:outer membrane immunogenic protein